MRKIEPQPGHNAAQLSLDWLSESNNHCLDESGLNNIIRLLIAKVNELADEVEFLRNRVNQHDNII